MSPLRTASRLIPALLILILAACAADKPEVAVRPAIVVQPSGAGAGLSAFAGEVHARQEPELAFRVGGKIARRLVDAGARVKAGQPLAELDASDLQLQLESARAQVASAQADLALAQ